MPLLALSVLISTSSTSFDTYSKKVLKEKEDEIKCLYEEVNTLRSEVNCYENLIVNKVAVSKFNNKRVSTNKKAINNFIPFSTANMSLHKNFITCLHNCSYEGICKVTSGLRKKCTKSLHSKGKAIDINWDDYGKNFAE